MLEHYWIQCCPVQIQCTLCGSSIAHCRSLLPSSVAQVESTITQCRPNVAQFGSSVAQCRSSVAPVLPSADPVLPSVDPVLQLWIPCNSCIAKSKSAGVLEGLALQTHLILLNQTACDVNLSHEPEDFHLVNAYKMGLNHNGICTCTKTVCRAWWRTKSGPKIRSVYMTCFHIAHIFILHLELRPFLKSRFWWIGSVFAAERDMYYFNQPHCCEFLFLLVKCRNNNQIYWLLSFYFLGVGPPVIPYLAIHKPPQGFNSHKRQCLLPNVPIKVKILVYERDTTTPSKLLNPNM
jgi:hypothetical protein